MGSQQTFEPTWALIKKPANYPPQPLAGKIRLIWETNNKSLYHRLSPYSQYDANQGLIKGFTTQPYYYTYPDEGGKGLTALRKYESRAFPLGSAPIDVIRVSKFLGSGQGIIFLGKQFLLQTGNAFNETRIYNPTSPIIAAGMGLALGTVRPQRNFDTSGGLGGIARTLIGSSIPNAIFGAPKVSKPFGTAPDALIEGPLATTGGKGLIRAGTATTAKAHLDAAWPPPGAGLNKTFSSVAKGIFKSVFANFIPQTQPGIQHRSDEGAYGLMISGGNTKFSYIGASSKTYGWGQLWIAGGRGIRKNNEYPSTRYRIFVKNEDGVNNINFAEKSDTGFLGYISEVGTVGYTVSVSGDINNPGYRYGDSIGIKKSTEYQASDIMYQYKYYADPAQKFPTKQTQTDVVNKRKDQLTKVIDKLKGVSGGLYNVKVPNDARTISTGAETKNGYDRLFATNQKGRSAMNYPLGVMQDYRYSQVVDNSVNGSPIRFSKKFSTAGHFDALNTLNVLDKDMKIKNSKLKSWDKWEPYEDDQIAFYFYDVVNEKYIPFRAAIKGLSEASNASWEEMPFIGRGDKVYSYGGFNRNLSMNINIVISSLAELAPTWQRINYLTTLVKPANYTTSNYNGVMNRFMIPPMVMMTIGDLYKDQPILINSITTAIPDDASWETQNEFNSEQWEYLASFMTSQNSVLYGQLPRTVDIALGLVLLEKERAIVGGANFGHAPRLDNLNGWNTTTVPTGGIPNKLHNSLVVTKESSPVLIDAGTPYQSTVAQNEAMA